MDTMQPNTYLVDRICKEVSQHGFYIEYVKNLVNRNLGEKEMERAVRQMAAKAGLKVSFNRQLGLCIFECRT